MKVIFAETESLLETLEKLPLSSDYGVIIHKLENSLFACDKSKLLDIVNSYNSLNDDTRGDIVKTKVDVLMHVHELIKTAEGDDCALKSLKAACYLIILTYKE